MSNIESPTDSTYGYVIATIIRRGADGDDPDDYPDAIAAKGTITFTPHVKVAKTTTPSAFEIRESIKLPLNERGELAQSNETASVGCWLLTGTYTVSFDIRDAVFPTFVINVTTSHTLENPYNLISRL